MAMAVTVTVPVPVGMTVAIVTTLVDRSSSASQGGPQCCVCRSLTAACNVHLFYLFCMMAVFVGPLSYCLCRPFRNTPLLGREKDGC